eukprot:PLAT9771.1.p1 GENE.PLAT9771.1~~PLAT9771.1.p1  ORF type:complete len:1198 (+),score=594.86 PLAT9771.1:165-3596(+)
MAARVEDDGTAVLNAAWEAGVRDPDGGQLFRLAQQTGWDASNIEEWFRWQRMAIDASLTDDAGHWVMPSRGKAKQARQKAKFKDGKASLCSSPRSLSAMGPGTILYFKLLKQLSIVFLVMSILAAPAILLSFSGRKISTEDRDALGLSTFTAGNIGDQSELACGGEDCADATAAAAAGNDSSIVSVGGVTFNTTVIHYSVAGLLALPSTTASLIISASDILYTLVFFVFAVVYQSSVRRVAEDADADLTSLADYSVVVTGLPRDATEEQIRDHFSRLFGLDSDSGWAAARRGGCCGGHRPDRPEPGTAPVADIDMHGKESYLGSWVADVAIAHPRGKAIRTFLAKKKATSKLVRLRQRVKMYSEGTELPTGPDARKAEAAAKKAAKMEEKIAKWMSRIDSSRAHDCVAAFVTFKHDASLRRCLRDYQGSTGFFKRASQPVPLRFRGKHKLTVERAPEPSDIVWENLEVSSLQRGLRRAITTLVTFILLIVSFLIIFWARANKDRFAAAVPSLSLCATALPRHFSLLPEAEDALPMRRGTSGCSGPLDDADAVAPLLYTSPYANSSQLIMAAAAQAGVAFNGSQTCIPCTHQDCGTMDCVPLPCFSSCVSPSSSLLCPTPACWAGNITSSADRCRMWVRTTLTGCYCREALLTALRSASPLDAGQQLAADEGDVCGQFVTDFVLGNTLTLAAAAAVVVINLMLKSFMKSLVHFERHASVTAESVAVSSKLFVAQFLNTAVIVLLVSARLPNNIPNPLKPFGVLEGAYSDFDSGWYATVGVSLMITMLVNTLAPHAGPLLQACFVRPLCRLCKRGDVISQRDMNKLYRSPPFDISTRYPLVLNTLFVSLMYAGGLPLLLPLGFVSFLISYWIDKYMVLRVYSQPPSYDEKIATLAGNSMPFAALLHLAFSIWMYGNNEVLRSAPLSSSLIRQLVNVDESGTLSEESIQRLYATIIQTSSAYDPIGFVPKAIRLNVAPLLLLFALLLVLLITTNAARGVGQLLRRVLYVLTCTLAFRGDNAVDVDHVYNPALTEAFEHVVARGTELSSSEKRDGYYLEDAYGFLTLRKRWMADGVVEGIPHVRDQLKRTWEVIRDEGIASFNIYKNPKYAEALLAADAAERPSFTTLEYEVAVGEEEVVELVHAAG